MEHLRLLDILREHRGAYISGEEISRRLSISRTAVWKQINKLREEGYEFEAVSRKGYRLVFAPDKLEEGDVLEGLQTKSFGRHLNLMEVTSSTQEAARLLAEEGAPEGTLVIAEEQTGAAAAKGRDGILPPVKGYG